MHRLTKLEVGYIAGIVDGEGHFDLRKLNKGKSYCPRLRIAQVDKRLCDWLLNKIGQGKISFIEKKSKNPNWHDVYIYELLGWYNCIRLTLQIYPLLIVKKEQVNKIFGNKLSSKYTRLLKLYRSNANRRWKKYLEKKPQIPWNKGKKYTEQQKNNIANGIRRYWSGLYKEPRFYGKKLILNNFNEIPTNEINFKSKRMNRYATNLLR